MSEQLPEWVEIGTSFCVLFGNSNDTLWHVRGLVDDMVVLRRWNRVKKRWAYEVFDETFFIVYASYIKKVK